VSPSSEGGQVAKGGCSTDIVVSKGKHNFRVEALEYAIGWKHILSKSTPGNKVSSYSLGCVHGRVALRKDKYEDGELSTREQRFFGGLLHQWRSTSLRKDYDVMQFNNSLAMPSDFPRELNGEGTVRFTPAKASCEVTRLSAHKHMSTLATMVAHICGSRDGHCESVRALDFLRFMSEASDLSSLMRQLEAMDCSGGSRHEAQALEDAARTLYSAANADTSGFDIAYSKLDEMGCLRGTCSPTMGELREVFSLLVHGPDSEGHAAVLRYPISNELIDKVEREDDEQQYAVIAADLAQCISKQDCSSTEEAGKMYAKEWIITPDDAGNAALLQKYDERRDHLIRSLRELQEENKKLEREIQYLLNEPRWHRVARNVVMMIGAFLLAIAVLVLSPIILLLSILVALVQVVVKAVTS
jgi:hypothetical protein